MTEYRVAIVGATGLVGQEFIKVLEQRNFPMASILLLASDRSAGKKLFVNADVEKGGWVKAAVLSVDSNSIDSYTLDDSIALSKDTTKGQMTWKSKKKLVPPGDGHLRLVFQLKNAKLYSFWIE